MYSRFYTIRVDPQSAFQVKDCAFKSPMCLVVKKLKFLENEYENLSVNKKMCYSRSTYKDGTSINTSAYYGFYLILH